MNYVERRPPGSLRTHVECLWAVWDDGAVADRPPERIVPDGCPELIIHTGDVFERRDAAGQWKAQPRAFLAGTLTRPWILRPGRRPRTVGIRFRPGAAGGFLDVSMKDTVDRETSLVDIAGAAAAELIDAVGEAPTIEASLGVAAALLSTRHRRVVARPGARPAVGLTLASRGRTRVEDVARALGWSRRRLERAFDQDLGISPKLFARIVRLTAVLASLDDSARGRAVDVALEAGYFDQSHLLRDFRQLAGGAPRSLGLASGDLSRHLTRPERLRVLLADA